MRTRELTIVIVAVALVAFVAPASAGADFRHLIAPGETLTSVAAADGLSVDQLAAANGLGPDASLTAGATLAIPPRGASNPGGSSTGSTGSAATSASDTAATGGYRVAPGDTLSAIAVRHGVTLEQLAAANGLDPAAPLPAGATLTIPGGATPAAPATVAASSAGDGAQPTDESVSPSDVGRVAASEGVSPSLAEAVADQESGFDNGAVSPTGATGVMQIEPGTWRYIRTELGGAGLAPNSAHDNVLAGVELLHSLLAQTGGDPALAAAGYYQGLQSVREHGLYRDTRRYVRAVTALRSRFGGP
jgi:soluble lytic murein transglycosylase-like protein